MSSTEVDSALASEIPAVAPQHPLRRALLHTPEGLIGTVLALLLLLLITVGALFAATTAPGDSQPALGPSAAHLLGTDALGRDVFDRLAAGGTTIVLIPLVATTLALLVGGGAGLVAGAVGGIVDSVITRLFDLLLTLPPILVVLFVVGVMGSSNTVLVITVAVVYAPQFGRIVRGATQSVSVNLYVAAAQSRGERMAAIVGREIMPNTYAPVIATYALNFTYAILFVAGLSFLGLGVQPPNPDWGLMISENRSILAVAPMASLAPALAVTALAVSINLIADAITKQITGTSDRGVAL